jgi:putative transposase
MARQARLTIPGMPHHVIQRGNNRQAIVGDDADRQAWLDLLSEESRQHGVAVHAYVLMDNHSHLLVTPSTSDGLSKMMQALGRRYVRRFNDKHGRTGTLWEGRYRSSLVQTERYFLACMVYLDLNPVRAGMVTEAAAYPWSSHRHYIGTRRDHCVTPHAVMWGLGNTPFAREAAYAELVAAGLSQQQQAVFTRSVLSGWAVGTEAFVAELAEQTERRLGPGKRGRPPKAIAVSPLPMD